MPLPMSRERPLDSGTAYTSSQPTTSVPFVTMLRTGWSPPRWPVTSRRAATLADGSDHEDAVDAVVEDQDVVVCRRSCSEVGRGSRDAPTTPPASTQSAESSAAISATGNPTGVGAASGRWVTRSYGVTVPAVLLSG